MGVCAQTQFAVQKAGVIGERGLQLKVQSRAEPFIADGDDDHRHLVVCQHSGAEPTDLSVVEQGDPDELGDWAYRANMSAPRLCGSNCHARPVCPTSLAASRCMRPKL